MANRKKNPPPENLPTFDSIEEQIRGEEILNEQESRRSRDEAKIKKELENQEVNRRLEELRNKIKDQKSKFKK